MPTKAEALAVALDHAEETGEYSLVLRKRVAALWPQLNFVVEIPSQYGTQWLLNGGTRVLSLARGPQDLGTSLWILTSPGREETTRWHLREVAEQWARKRLENAGYVCVILG